MARPTFLVLEPEPADALSTRKLVLETAKFNVITAHSATEAMEILEGFPSLQAVVVVATMNGCGKVVSAAKTLHPKMPVIMLAPNPTHSCKGDHNVSTHDPEGLVTLMRTLFGDPRRKS